MAWYLAPALQVLRAEVDTRWPNRDRASDGTIGDAAHQASRSDHNENERGSVDAADFDKDGIDVDEVIAAVERHPSSHYWIYNRQIADRDDNWRRRPYTGSNPHDKHLHVSIRQTRLAEQDRRPWGLLKEDDMSEKASRLIEAWAVGKTATTARETVEPVKWRIRDEAWQKRVDGLLVALAASVEGLDMDAVLRRLDEHAAAEAQRDADLAELVRQANSGDLAAEEFLRRVSERFNQAAGTAPQAG